MCREYGYGMCMALCPRCAVLERSEEYNSMYGNLRNVANHCSLSLYFCFEVDETLLALFFQLSCFFIYENIY
jgi:hypothetical protein